VDARTTPLTTARPLAPTTPLVVTGDAPEAATDERSLSPDEAENKPVRKRIVACGRVSTEKQAEEGVSLDLQASKFEHYAVAHDVELVKTFSDALSGKSMKRPGLQEALAMLERGEADGLLVTKLDRLTRNVADFESLLQRYFVAGRFDLLSVEDAIDTRTALGRFTLRLYVILGQLERERLAERTKDSLRHKRATGGGTPRVEGPVVERIVALENAGHSLRAIAEQLTAEGVPTLKGGKWASETVRKIISRVRST
jgi:site-specific DNA recombinase